MDDEKWNDICNQASKLFVVLRNAQIELPPKSIQRVETARLAHAIDCYCRFVEHEGGGPAVVAIAEGIT